MIELFYWKKAILNILIEQIKLHDKLDIQYESTCN
jgi:hypothetical protein